MLRFFFGLCLGVIFTICSLGFIGVGHGTYVPMVFTGSLIAFITYFGAIPVIVLAPFLWALYYLLIPKIRTKRTRITTAAIALSLHILTGTASAIEDPAFRTTLHQELTQLMIFGLLWGLGMTFLLYFAVRGSSKTSSRTIGPI